MRGDYLPTSAAFNENVCDQYRVIVGLTARVYAFARFPTHQNRRVSADGNNANRE